MKGQTKHRFWKIYAAVFGAAFVLVFAFFFVFFDMMSNYEQAQPISGAQAFIDTITDDDLDQLIADVAANGNEIYADSDTIIRLLGETITPQSLTYTKDYATYTAEKPVFILSCGNLPVYRLTLQQGDEIRYGFSSWETANAEPILSVQDLELETSHIYVPHGAALFVNGTQVTAEPDGTAPYLYVSQWESADALLWDFYHIKHIGEAEFTCSRDGTACEMKTEEDALHFLYPAQTFHSYTIQAPLAAAVTVNGITLTDADILEKDIPYDLSAFETALENRPTTVLYTVDGLTKLPEITAELSGETLTVTHEDNSFYAAYPETLMYSCTIRVPSGSAVLLHGVRCTAENLLATEPDREELFSYYSEIPSFDVYTLTGLFCPPDDIEIIYLGNTLPCDQSIAGNQYTIETSYPKIDSPETKQLALDFVQKYFVYTSNGYLNIKQNLANVLAYIPYGCTLYAKIVQSENGFSWTSPVTSMTYNTLEVKNIFSYPNGLRLCEIEFDVSQNFSDEVHRKYSGTMLLVITSAGKVVGMEIDTNA